MNQNWEKPTYVTWRSASSFINNVSLARLREWNLWFKMIDTLIITFRRFDWVSAISRKVLTLLESALWHFVVLKSLWQLSTTSQDQLKWKRTRSHTSCRKHTSNVLPVKRARKLQRHLISIYSCFVSFPRSAHFTIKSVLVSPSVRQGSTLTLTCFPLGSKFNTWRVKK